MHAYKNYLTISQKCNYHEDAADDILFLIKDKSEPMLYTWG